MDDHYQCRQPFSITAAGCSSTRRVLDPTMLTGLSKPLVEVTGSMHGGAEQGCVWQIRRYIRAGRVGLCRENSNNILIPILCLIRSLYSNLRTVGEQKSRAAKHCTFQLGTLHFFSCGDSHQRGSFTG